MKVQFVSAIPSAKSSKLVNDELAQILDDCLKNSGQYAEIEVEDRREANALAGKFRNRIKKMRVFYPEKTLHMKVFTRENKVYVGWIESDPSDYKYQEVN